VLLCTIAFEVKMANSESLRDLISGEVLLLSSKTPSGPV